MTDNGLLPPNGPSAFDPVEYISGDRSSGLLLICDHARSDIPSHYRQLGLPDEQLTRHIAYDIGVRAVTLNLARRLNVPAVLSTFSRLLIDPNRGHDDPTLVMRISDGALIPGNARIDADEVLVRRERFYEPYHRAVADELEAMEEANDGRVPSIFSIHSFTPVWRGLARPWEVGILWDSDPRMAVPVIDALKQDAMLTVGDNEPYDGALLNDCMFHHGTSQGRAHALLELRQDLIADEEGVARWVDCLEPILRAQIDNSDLGVRRYYPSRTGAPLSVDAADHT
ncbi:MAG: N-formylglutamate amidohydrolase [Pseudomonadota bacterium]